MPVACPPEAAGYLHPDYARSLAEFGRPRELPACGGWILVRDVPEFPAQDGMGCYPLFICRDWRALPRDIESLPHDLVTLTLVTDPFGDFDRSLLTSCFDRVIPFKEHFVVDYAHPVDSIVSASHRRTIRRALKKVDVEICPAPVERLDEWMSVFETLADRHQIRGLRAFSRRAFQVQLGIPGLVMFRAVAGGITVGLDIWYRQGDIAYGHLAAFSPRGYELRASYATKWHVINHFADKVRWLDLGGGAGGSSDGSDGLTAFKRGWATGTRIVYLCGRVLDAERYGRILAAKGMSDEGYFPGYRRGEFA